MAAMRAGSFTISLLLALFITLASCSDAAEVLRTPSGTVHFIGGQETSRWVLVPPAGAQAVTTWFTGFHAADATVKLFGTANPYLQPHATWTDDAPPLQPTQIHHSAANGPTFAVAVEVDGSTAATAFTLHYIFDSCENTTHGLWVNATSGSFTDGSAASAAYPTTPRTCKWVLNPLAVQPLSVALPSAPILVSFARVSLNKGDELRVVSVNSWTQQQVEILALDYTAEHGQIRVDDGQLAIVEFSVTGGPADATGFALQFFSQPPGCCGLTLQNPVASGLLDGTVNTGHSCSFTVEPVVPSTMLSFSFDQYQLQKDDSISIEVSDGETTSSQTITGPPGAPVIFTAPQPSTFHAQVQFSPSATAAARQVSMAYASGTCDRAHTVWYKTTSGVVTDGSGAGQVYPLSAAGTNCTWTIEPPAGGPLSIRLESASLCGQDYVTVFQRSTLTGEEQGALFTASESPWQPGVVTATALSGSAVIMLAFSGCTDPVDTADGFAVAFGSPLTPEDVCGQTMSLVAPYAIGLGQGTAAGKAQCVWALQPETPHVFTLTLTLRQMLLQAGDTLTVYNVNKISGARSTVASYTSASGLPQLPLVVQGDASADRVASAVVELTSATTADAAATSTFTLTVAPGQCVPQVPTYLNGTSGIFTDGTAASVLVPKASGSCIWRIAPNSAQHNLGPVIVRASRLQMGNPVGCIPGSVTVTPLYPATGEAASPATGLSAGMQVMAALTGSAMVSYTTGTCDGEYGMELAYGAPTVPDNVCAANSVKTQTVPYAIGLSTASGSSCGWSIQPSGGADVYQITVAVQEFAITGTDSLVVYSVNSITGDKTQVASFTANAPPTMPVVVLGVPGTNTVAAASVELVAGAGEAASTSTFTASVIPGQCVPGLPMVMQATHGTFTDGTVASMPMTNVAGGSCSWVIEPQASEVSLGPVAIRSSRMDLIPAWNGMDRCTGGTVQVSSRNPATGEVLELLASVQGDEELAVVSTTGSAVVEFIPGTCTANHTGFEISYSVMTEPDTSCGTDTRSDVVPYTIGSQGKAAPPCSWVLAPSQTMPIYTLTLSVTQLQLAAGDELTVFSVDPVTNAKTQVAQYTSTSSLPLMPLTITSDPSSGVTVQAEVQLTAAAGAGAHTRAAAASTFNIMVVPGQCAVGVPMQLNGITGLFTDGTAADMPLVNTLGGVCSWVVAPLASKQSLGPLVVRASRVDLIPEWQGFDDRCSGGLLQILSRNPTSGLVGEVLAQAVDDQALAAAAVTGSAVVQFTPGTCPNSAGSTGFQVLFGLPTYASKTTAAATTFSYSVPYSFGADPGTATSAASSQQWHLTPTIGAAVYQLNLFFSSLQVGTGATLEVYSVDSVANTQTLVATYSSESVMPDMPVVVLGSVNALRTANAMVKLTKAAKDATTAFTIAVSPGQCVPNAAVSLQATSGTFNDGSEASTTMPSMQGAPCSWVIDPAGSKASLGPLVMRSARMDLVPSFQGLPPCTGGTVEVYSRNPDSGAKVQLLSTVVSTEPIDVTSPTGSAIIDFTAGTCVGQNTGFEVNYMAQQYTATLHVANDSALIQQSGSNVTLRLTGKLPSAFSSRVECAFNGSLVLNTTVAEVQDVVFSLPTVVTQQEVPLAVQCAVMTGPFHPSFVLERDIVLAPSGYFVLEGGFIEVTSGTFTAGGEPSG